MKTMTDGATPSIDDRSGRRRPLPGTGLGWGAIIGVAAGVCCVLALTLGLALFWVLTALIGSYDQASLGFGLMLVLVVGSLVGGGIGAGVGTIVGTFLGLVRWEGFATWVALPCAAVPIVLAPRVVESALTTTELVLAVAHVLVVSAAFAGIGFGAGRVFANKLDQADERDADEHAAVTDRAEMDRLLALQKLDVD